MGILIILCILGYVATLHLLVRRHLELNLFATISAMVVVLYAFAFLGWQKPAAHTLFYLGLGLIPICGYLYYARYRELAKDLVSPGIVTFVVVAVLYWINFKDIYIHYWDEFSHWSIITKEMLMNHQLPTSESYSSIKSYSRGTNLFQYFVALHTEPLEGRFYFAQFLLVLAPLIIFFQNLSWKRAYWGVVGVISGLFLVHVFGLGVDSLYVDHIVGLYFGMAILAYFTTPLRWKELGLFIPILAVLPFIKTVGMFLSLAVVCLIGADWLLSHLLFKVGKQHNSPFLQLRRLRRHQKTWFAGIVILLVVAGPFASWNVKYRNELLNISETFGLGSMSWESIENLWTGNLEDFQKQTVTNFYHGLFTRPVSSISGNFEPWKSVRESLDFPLFAGSMVGWTVCLFAIFVVTFFSQKELKGRLRIGLVFSALLVGLIGFMFMLLLSFVYLFGPYEGPRLASFERYANTFFLAFWLVGVGLLLHAQLPQGIWQIGKRAYYVLGGWVTLVLVILVGCTPRVGLLAQDTDRQDLRALMHVQMEHLKVVKSVLDQDEKLYVVFQNTSGMPVHVIRYEMIPRRISGNCNSLGKPYYQGDIWTCDWPVEKWADALTDYEYVYLARIDQPFWSRYSSLFHSSTQGNDFLFKVNPHPETQVMLLPIRNAQ